MILGLTVTNIGDIGAYGNENRLYWVLRQHKLVILGHTAANIGDIGIMATKIGDIWAYGNKYRL